MYPLAVAHLVIFHSLELTFRNTRRSNLNAVYLNLVSKSWAIVNFSNAEK